jgi:polyisoprenyl-phosphate glycosyltransferase
LELDLLQRTDQEMSDQLCLSIAVPVHNEETTIPELLLRTCAVLDQIPGGPHEILFVDDGSSDHTLEILEEAASDDSRVNVISLSRNFGHQAALSAALDYASGDAVILMDGDLQDRPEVIPRLLEGYYHGCDVVYAIRTGRKETWLLRCCYFLFYRMLSILSETPLPIDAGDFGLMSRRVVEQLRRMPERHRFLRGLRSWVGFRQMAISVERDARHSGESKYGLLKLMKLASDGIFAFSIVPLRTAIVLGALAVAASTLFAVWSVLGKVFLHRPPQGFVSLVLLITFLSGVLLFFLGIIGEYVGRIYEEIKARPVYIVSKIVGSVSSSNAFNGFRESTAERQRVTAGTGNQ